VKARIPEPVRQGDFSSFGWRGWIGGCIALIAVFGFQGFYPSLIGPISNLLPTFCAAIALAAVLVCAKRYGFGFRTKFQAAWISFAVGFGLWVAAESIWTTYVYVLGVQIPDYSAADVFYMGGYFPVFAGLVLYLSAFQVALEKKRIVAAVVAMALAASAVYYTVLPTVLAAAGTTLQVLDDLTFVSLDLVMLTLVVLTFTIFVGGRISKWLMVLGGAAVLYVIGDEDFLIQTANGTYYNGSYNDLIFLLAYLTFALAFYLHRREW
jgi:hypothetical protein